jgi:hypothetical protein
MDFLKLFLALGSVAVILHSEDEDSDLCIWFTGVAIFHVISFFGAVLSNTLSAFLLVFGLVWQSIGFYIFYQEGTDDYVLFVGTITNQSFFCLSLAILAITLSGSASKAK